MNVDIGISDSDRKEISEGLKKVQADTFTLYLKTHFYHWNVTGPMFETLHLMFETHYNELWLAIDLLAERLRALGFYAIGTYKVLSDMASIEDDTSVPKATEMIENLVKGHEAVIKTIRSSYKAAEKANDQGTLDIYNQRLSIHEKTAWMLRSLLEK